jgi:threonine/homoserine/homoserine lactone efflux protein
MRLATAEGGAFTAGDHDGVGKALVVLGFGWLSEVMLSTGAVVGIAAVALGLVLTPGPNMIYLVSRSLTQGRRAGLISLGGVAAGFLVYLAAATAGLVAIFAVVPVLYTVIKLTGAAYLLWLAWQTLRPGGTSVFEPAPLPPDGARRLFTMGLVTNLLNPKIAILYVSLLPQFVDPGRGSVAMQSLLLGVVQICVALTVNGLIVLSAGAIAGFLRTRPAWLKIQRYVMGSVLAGLAVKIATDRSKAIAVTA